MIVAEQLYKIRNAKYCKENESKYTHRPFEPFKSKMLSNKVAESVDAKYLTRPREEDFSQLWETMSRPLKSRRRHIPLQILDVS